MMNRSFNNKNIALIVLAAAVLGGLIGWLLKPADRHMGYGEEAHQKEEGYTGEWTCSMHPKIRSADPGQCPICGMDLIPATSAKSTNTDPTVFEMTPEAVAMANVHTTRVTGVSQKGELVLTGKIEADERQRASVTAKFPGRIDRLFVNFTGQEIKPGERLATIYSPELINAQKELFEAASTKDIYPEMYNAVREKLRLWRLTERQIDRIESSGKLNESFDVLAEKGGVVTQRNISEGDYVSTGTVLFEIADLSKIWVMIDAYESDLPLINVGDQVSFMVSGRSGKTHTAKVSYIDPIVDDQKRSASVRAEVPNKDGSLKPGMFVTARIKTSSHNDKASHSVPRTAVLWTGKRSVVYVKVPDADMPSFEMREVTIGTRVGDMYEIESGLEVGEEVITNGAFAVDAAAQLAGRPSMMNRDGGPAITAHDHGNMGASITPTEQPNVKEIKIDRKAKQALKPVINEYFALKNALVADDLNSAKKHAAYMKTALGKVDMKLFKGESHDIWMRYSGKLEDGVTNMAQVKDIETARTHFITLSDQLVSLNRRFDLLDQKVYVQHCPMANNDKGADWLSLSEEIENPYYGAAMLKCGEVREVLE